MSSALMSAQYHEALFEIIAMNTRIKPRKKQAVEAALRKTTRTNELVYRLQSHPMPFEIAFWQLLELTRTLERELAELQDSLGTTEDETHACQI